MGISGCRSRDQSSAGSAMMAHQEAMHHSQDYDAMRGHDFVQLFFPIDSTRNYANVPLYFVRDSRLYGKKLTAMEMVNNTQLASFGGKDMPSSYANGWIVLRDNCDNVLAELPLSRLNNVTNGGKNLFFRKLPVDWGKSYLHLTSTPGTSIGFLFNIWTIK
jgi:hypothetical protein